MISRKRVERTLLFLTLLFLPTQLGRHFWPQFSFVYSLPIDYLSPTFYFWDILVGLLWVVFISSKKHINRAALSFLYFFILTQALSLLFNPLSVAGGLIRLEQFVISGLFGVYIASLKKTEISKIFLPLSLAVLGESVLAVLQFLKGGSVGFWVLGERTFSLSTPAIAKFDFYGREFLRPYGTFPHPNVLAGFVLITLLLLPARRAVATLGALALLLTVSRVTIVAGFISAMFVLKSNGRKLIILTFILLLPVLYARYSSIFSFDSLTLLRREELTFTAFNLWLSYPLFGVGLNNFIPYVSEQVVAGPSRFLQPVHNIFLLALSETGIVGLVGLISLIGYPLYKRKFLIAWASLIFLGLFDHYFLTLPQGYRLLFLIWGLSLSIVSKHSVR